MEDIHARCVMMTSSVPQHRSVDEGEITRWRHGLPRPGVVVDTSPGAMDMEEGTTCAM